MIKCMKAIVYKKYGSPNVFELLELEKPTPQPGEVLIKVFASTVTAADCMMRRGDTILSRILLGLIKPGKKYQILGTEFSGIIEAAGSKVKKFKPGDEVYAFRGFGTGLRSIFMSAVFSFLAISGFTQSIPVRNLYLDQTPPGCTPKIFPLAVKQGFFAAERIAISDDGKYIYYSEIKGYYTNTGESIKKYSFSEGKWTGPVILFEGYAAPALSITGDTMFVETNFETYISIKKDSLWTKPKRILTGLDSAHYYQVTRNGNYYISTKSGKGEGLSDWCRILINKSDTTALSIGRPLNTSGENLDFFVSGDESFMIVTNRPALGISYRKDDGSWTNPRNFGPKINFGLGSWGPWVTPDNKYLFYSTGTKPDYSDVGVFWVRIDGIIDSLKQTNLSPSFP